MTKAKARKGKAAPAADFNVDSFGSIVGITPMNAAAREWIAENVSSEGWQWLGATLNIDTRYAEDLINGISEAGFTVKAD
jgi:hypothetical protein